MLDPSDSAYSDETPTQRMQHHSHGSESSDSSAPPAVYPATHAGAAPGATENGPETPFIVAAPPSSPATPPASAASPAFSPDVSQFDTARIPAASRPRTTANTVGIEAEATRIVPVTSAGRQPSRQPSQQTPTDPSASLLPDDMAAPDPRGDTRADLLPLFSLRDAELMQQREWSGWQRAVGWVDNADRRKRKGASKRRGAILAIAVVLLVGVPALLAVSLWPSLGITLGAFGVGGGANEAPAGATQWARDTQLTPYDADDAAFAQQHYPVDAAFQSYYTTRNGAALLGVALTPGFATQQGRVQFFSGGALLAPNPSAHTGQTGPTGATSAPGDITGDMAHNGYSDASTHVIWLPLIQSLLTAGSEAQALPLLSPSASSATASTPAATATATTSAVPSAAPAITQSSALTYADLRHAATPDAFVVQPGRDATSDGAMFIAEGKRNGKSVGHLIPAQLWAWLQAPADAPDGWKTDFGDPLTEALPLTVTLNGQTHHLLVQAFLQTALAYDTDDANGEDGPAITPLTLGAGYLLTLGPPTVAATPNVKTWATGDTALLDAPQTGKSLVHIGLNFPLALTSDAAQWKNGILWYKAAWQQGHASGAGWLSATTLTFSAPPPDADAYASFDVLSPSVAQYLASLGGNVGAVVYDMTRRQYYTYNANSLFILASSAKVSLMVAYLHWIESQGRSPNGNDQALLTTMIENSNNNSAQAIYDTLGDGGGMQAYLPTIGITDYQPNPNGWGWGRWSPLDMAHILTLLQEGKVLNATDRAYALSLMRNIEPDQRMGIGQTAPAGAVYEMKDGWVPGPDGLWAINTSGIVTVGGETYIITVYTGEQTSYDGGWYITRQVCGPVGTLLT